MANAKLSALAVLTGAGVAPSADLLYIVDTSASTSKKILVSELGIVIGFSTGDEKTTWKTVADAGWIMLNDGTIGSAASGATTRANADTESLYTLWWNNCADAQCPVSTGRGANAAADFAANKTLKTPLSLGRVLAIAGAGAGLTSRVLGLATGAETHTLTTAEMPAHTHQTQTFGGGASGSTVSTKSPGNDTPTNIQATSSTGSGGAHNNMPPGGFRNVMVKL